MKHQQRDILIERVRATYAERSAKLAGIKTRQQALAWRAEVRRKLARCFGPLPARTSLNVRVTKTIQGEGFSIECLLFESRPGFLVSANFYLPVKRVGPLPAVLVSCGHAHDAKAYDLYQDACLRLVHNGYAVLIYDPINQGERLFNPRQRATANLCGGHNLVGKQMMLMDERFCTWRLWDGLRALDYLVSRPEVDKRQLGVTGQSGGGTLSSYLWAFDTRLRMLATSCWQTSYLYDLENEVPADAEQYPPGLLKAGLDKIDFLMARLGEPALLLGQEYDFFDERGLRQGYAELQRLHVLAGGAPDLCQLSIDKGDHAFSQGNQEAMLRFFNHALGRPAPRMLARPPRRTEEELTATPKNDVMSVGSIPMSALVCQIARASVGKRSKSSDAVRCDLQKLLGIKLPAKIPYYRQLFYWYATRKKPAAVIRHFGLETAPGMVNVLRRVVPEPMHWCLEVGKTAHVYLPNIASSAELESPKTMRGYDDFWCFDARGFGDGFWGEPEQFGTGDYNFDYMVFGFYQMYDESLLGLRVGDVLSMVALLRSKGARKIYLHGQGHGALLALIAGVLDQEIAGIYCRGAPQSYLALACDARMQWPSSCFVRGLFPYLDLPDLRRVLGRRLKANADCGAPFKF